MDTREKILQCFINIGVVIDDSENYVDLKEYVSDSIQFVTAVVEIEREFSIEFPDDLLVFSVFDSLNGLVNIVDTLLMESNEVNINDDKVKEV